MNKDNHIRAINSTNIKTYSIQRVSHLTNNNRENRWQQCICHDKILIIVFTHLKLIHKVSTIKSILLMILLDF